MAAQFTPTYNPKPTGPNPSGLLLVLLFGGLLRQATLPLCGLLCSLASQLIGTLPSLILAVVHAHQAGTLDYPQIFTCFEVLTSYAPLLHCIFGAI